MSCNITECTGIPIVRRSSVARNTICIDQGDDADTLYVDREGIKYLRIALDHAEALLDSPTTPEQDVRLWAESLLQADGDAAQHAKMRLKEALSSWPGGKI